LIEKSAPHSALFSFSADVGVWTRQMPQAQEFQTAKSEMLTVSIFASIPSESGGRVRLEGAGCWSIARCADWGCRSFYCLLLY